MLDFYPDLVPDLDVAQNFTARPDMMKNAKILAKQGKFTPKQPKDGLLPNFDQVFPLEADPVPLGSRASDRPKILSGQASDLVWLPSSYPHPGLDISDKKAMSIRGTAHFGDRPQPMVFKLLITIRSNGSRWQWIRDSTPLELRIRSPFQNDTLFLKFSFFHIDTECNDAKGDITGVSVTLLRTLPAACFQVSGRTLDIWSQSRNEDLISRRL
ncbi:hypothetical protein BDZ89DRAFT_1032536 [Hymenopellis radicata]|nr:hypothetical protein BDZ89DRAFT_1032536 [Hymenopellis radicata]